MASIKLGLVTLLLLIATPNTTTAQLRLYKLPKFDVSDPSCKIIAADLIRLDQEFLGLSTFHFPRLESFAEKYGAAKARSKRNLVWSLTSLVTHSNTRKATGLLGHKKVLNLLGYLDDVFQYMGGCLFWMQGYFSYWFNELIGGVIALDAYEFFDALIPNEY